MAIIKKRKQSSPILLRPSSFEHGVAKKTFNSNEWLEFWIVQGFLDEEFATDEPTFSVEFAQASYREWIHRICQKYTTVQIANMVGLSKDDVQSVYSWIAAWNEPVEIELREKLVKGISLMFENGLADCLITERDEDGTPTTWLTGDDAHNARKEYRKQAAEQGFADFRRLINKDDIVDESNAESLLDKQEYQAWQVLIVPFRQKFPFLKPQPGKRGARKKASQFSDESRVAGAKNLLASLGINR